MGTWESFETFEILKFDYRGQNTSHWGVLYIIEKLSKCRCRKWACMSHLDIYSTSYGKRKGENQSGNLTPEHQKSGINLTPMCARGMRHTIGKLSTRATTLLETSSQSEVWTKSYSPAKLQESKPW
jgi:hypothetical protein